MTQSGLDFVIASNDDRDPRPGSHQQFGRFESDGSEAEVSSGS